VEVLYRLDGKQSSTSFEDLASAKKFQKLVDKFGTTKAFETLGIDPEFSAITVREWIEHHIDPGTVFVLLPFLIAAGIHLSRFANMAR
jgi:hypothetical protein